MTTENSSFWVSFLIRYGDSAVFVTLTATLLSPIVDIEWEISRLAVFPNFSNGDTVPVVFHSEEWSTEVGIISVVLEGIVRASSVRTGWGFAFKSYSPKQGGFDLRRQV